MTDASPKPPAPALRSVIGLLAALAADLLIIVGFFNTIAGALDASGTSPLRTSGPVMVLIGCFLWLAAVLLAGVSMFKRERKSFAVATLVIAAVPFVVYIVALISVRV